MTTVAERIANLSPAKRALLEQYLQQQRLHPNGSDANGRIPRRPDAAPPPLSLAQERLWFLDQMEPGSTAYNEQAAMRLIGFLDVDTLDASLAALVTRHAIFCTHYRQIDGNPVQIINDALTIPLRRVDLRALTPAERATALLEEARRDATQPFDLSCDPIARFTLVRLDEQEHLFLRTIHHIATDGWSSNLFWRDLSEIYRAHLEHRPPQLPDLLITYADYAVWQRQWLAAGPGEQQRAYWRNQLAGLAPLALPTDRPRPVQQSDSGARHIFAVADTLVAALNELARTENATLFMVLLAAFQVLLHRYSGQEDIAVGSPIAGRSRSETEPIIGFFVNTLVLRGNLADNPPFRTLLHQIRTTCLNAYANQDLPFAQLVAELQPERNLRVMPLAQVFFALQNTPHSPLQLTGITAEPLHLVQETAKFDLWFALHPQPEGLRATLEYSTDLFDRGTIERMAKHFCMLLAGIAENADTPIGQLPLLTEAERRQLLIAWNDTQTAYPDYLCIHQLFEAQCERTPDAVAVIFGDEQLRYRELNACANQLAHRLIALGVGPGVLVGIGVERSIEMVVGLVAILKAGGVYVPLDVTYPPARLAWMLEDTAAPVLLTQQRFAPLFPKTGVTVIVLDTIVRDTRMCDTLVRDTLMRDILVRDKGEDEIARQSQTNPSCNLASSAPAYLIYTSGSTGTPKGVMIPHRAISRLLINTNYIDILTTDRIAQASTIVFDAATFEIWGALTHGAILVGIPREVSLVPHELAAYLREQAVSILFLTTALFNQIAHSVPNAFATLRVLLFGGERADPTPVRLVLQHGAPTQLLHVYGPTESTTFSTWHLVQSVANDAQSIPIGVPLANTQLYLLDGQLQPVPIGVTGELYIGGDGLALGYHHRPELTAATFIANPFGEGRLYKTGDRARYLPDGNIEFLGRLDNQVKVRGFRIELGEIEAALTSHPAVREAVVVCEDSPADKRIVAYIVAIHALTNTQLHQFLAEKLPAYMLPTVMIQLDALPLTPNGKVDHRALPAPNMDRLSEAVPLVAPRSNVERQLADLWKELLGLEQVGIHDNFFTLGGHSLLTVRLIMQIKQQFAVDLSLERFFERPTIAQLAAWLEPNEAEPDQTAHANNTNQHVLNPQLAQLYEAIGVPGVVRTVMRPHGGRRWYLIHHALQRLPYGVRLTLVKQLTRQVARHQLFSARTQLIKEFLGSIETEVNQDLALDLALFYGLLHRYKVNMVQPGAKSPPHNIEKIKQARSQAQGVILLQSHTSLQFWCERPEILQAHIGGVHHLTATNDPNYATITDMLFTRQVEYAYQILQQGGVAHIAADGQHGKGTALLYDFHGRRRPFMTGFAELALATSAQVLPLTYTIVSTGEAIWDIGSPLDPGDDTLPRGDRVERLVAQYVALLYKLWAETPWLVPWYQMERHLVYPLR